VELFFFKAQTAQGTGANNITEQAPPKKTKRKQDAGS